MSCPAQGIGRKKEDAVLGTLVVHFSVQDQLVLAYLLYGLSILLRYVGFFIVKAVFAMLVFPKKLVSLPISKIR